MNNKGNLGDYIYEYNSAADSYAAADLIFCRYLDLAHCQFVRTGL